MPGCTQWLSVQSLLQSKKSFHMERNNAASSLPVSVLCVYIPTGVLFGMPFLCVTPVSLSGPSLFPSVTALELWCLFLLMVLGHKKKEPMKMPWLFHDNRNMERKPKNRCCQVSRIDRESRVSIRLLGEVSSNRKVLVPHRTASIRWLKNLLMSLVACKAEAVCWIHICVSFIMLYKPWEAF